MMIQQYFSIVTCVEWSRRIRTYIVIGEEELRRGLGVLEERRENLEECLADFSWGEIRVRLDSVKCQMQR